uniref:Anaphase-promoting complex subunit 2 n=1 Tax=Aceria tosichella TaxID=561515 RepID=A0A6G1SNQ5_9ACAR
MAVMSGNLATDMNLTIATAQKARQQPKIIYFRLLEARLNSVVKRDIVDKFWAYFPEQFDKYGPDSYKPLIDAVTFLKDSSQKIEKSLTNTGQEIMKETFFDSFKTLILSAKPYYLHDYIEATYFRAFRVYLNIEKNSRSNTSQANGDQPMECDDGDDASDLDEYAEFDDYARSRGAVNLPKPNLNICPGCSCSTWDKYKCNCNQIRQQFRTMNLYLRQLGLLDMLVGETIMTVARALIERRVAAKGKSNYSCSYMNELSIWVDSVVKGWFVEIYGSTNQGELDVITRKLDQFLRDAYAEVRISHMFEIIIEYPNSEAAIQDLKLCIEQSTSSSFRLNLIDSVKQSLVESLLHPGVNTYDILTAYISAIKALRALDPSGLILQLVTEPVRRYLKSRNDTVRCIVTALTDEDNNSELNREMIRSTQTNENGVSGKGGTIEMNLPNEGEKCTAMNFEKWRPDPIKLSSLDDVMKTSRFSDIVSILVNIYETKDLFVEEYQKLLSQRLLNKYDECNLDTELRNLELLTLRFNDCELHRCEVMLKDVQISKRVNKRIVSGDIKDQKLTEFKDLDVLIVSSPFWPDKFGPIAALSDEPPKINFPSEIQTAINTYTKAFEAIQASRTLHWRHHLGSVNMDVTINGKEQNFTVSPLHAALLYMFQNRKAWKLEEIIRETSLTAATVRSRLALWQRNGLIKDCGEDRFELICE